MSENGGIPVVQATIAWVYKAPERMPRCGREGLADCVTETIGQYSGPGDDEFLSEEMTIPPCLLTFKGKYEGDDNFIVWLNSEEWGRDLAFNLIGSFEDEKEFESPNPDTISIEVAAGEGAWSLEVSITR